jgi:hypothetical protein
MIGWCGYVMPARNECGACLDGGTEGIGKEPIGEYFGE